MLCLLWLGVRGKAFLSKRWKMALPQWSVASSSARSCHPPISACGEVCVHVPLHCSKMSWESLMDCWRWVWADPAHFVWNGLKSTHLTSFLCQTSGVAASRDGKQHQPIQWDPEEDFCLCPEKQVHKSHYLFSSLYGKTYINCKWGVDF